MESPKATLPPFDEEIPTSKKKVFSLAGDAWKLGDQQNGVAPGPNTPSIFNYWGANRSEFLKRDGPATPSFQFLNPAKQNGDKR